MDKDFPRYRIENKKEIDIFCSLQSSKVKPVIFGKSFFKPDILVCDSAFKLGSFPKMGKYAALVKTLTKDIPVIASGFSMHPSGKNVKLFNQILSFNKTRYKNFNEFAEDHIIKKMININGYKGTDYSNLSVNGLKWYNSFVDKCVIDLSVKKEKIDPTQDIIHTIDMPEIIKEKLEKVNNMKPFIIGRYYFNVIDESDKRKKIAQLSSGTIKLKDKRFIIDNSKVEFINKHYGDKKIIIFCVYDEEEKMLNEYFSRKKNVLVTKFKNEYFIKEDYEYAIFITLTENTLRYHETLMEFNNLKKVYIFFKGGFNQKIYRKMIMKIGNM
jgi:hypothetical protein